MCSGSRGSVTENGRHERFVVTSCHKNKNKRVDERSVPSPSRFNLNTRMAPWCPIRCSVIQTTLSSSSLNATRFTAVGNSQTYRHFPFETLQRRSWLSAEPETRNLDCASSCESPPRLDGGRKGVLDSQSTSIVHTVPL